MSPQCANVPLKPVSPADIKFATGAAQQGAQNVGNAAAAIPGAVAKPVTDAVGQLQAQAKAFGDMLTQGQHFMTWLLAPCTMGKYSTPTPCWFDGAVVLLVLWIIKSIVD